MNQSTAEPADTDETKALFRRVTAGVTDRVWNLRLDEEALAAL